jgi:hypothetical protein
MIIHLKYWTLIFTILCSSGLFAQREKVKNYRKFDDRLFHFGFTLGFNSADFSTYPVPGAYELYGVTAIENKSQPGGQVGILTTMKLGHPVARLRFIPTLSFQERVLTYYYPNPSPNPGKKLEITNEERLNSVNVDLPLMLQFRTTRYNNFAAYALVGAQYSVDLQSQEKVTQSYNNPFIKIKKYDFQGQVGGGVEFFLPYFKLGLELKYSQSFGNVMVQDESPVSLPLDRLYNRVWYFSIIFEG